MGRQRTGRSISGILIIDKPAGFSSNEVLQKIKKLYQVRKAGHTGILDKPATGVLPICFGKATKCATYLLDANKVYTAKIKLGECTDTGDASGSIIKTRALPVLKEQNINAVLQSFCGDILQTPPMYSALHHKGVRLHKLARKKVAVKRTPRPVKIYHLELSSIKLPYLAIKVQCSKGTYIRTLVEDIGEKLGPGAHVKELRRIQSGNFSINQANSTEYLQQQAEQGGLAALDKLLLPIDSALEKLPEVRLSNPLLIEYLRQGQAIMVSEVAHRQGPLRVYDQNGDIVAVGKIRKDGMLCTHRLLC